ncbi:MAG: 4-hydroxy-tetrahydrodipicolinate reductase, partial [Oscillospiraceae bacterium]|nr:4-hydroxy-tetrahydrodipicolinate reductase [Oscillospiraceae bacterium]
MKIMLAGYNGRMGRAIIEAVAEKPEEFTITVGIDKKPASVNPNFPIFIKPSDYKEKTDVIIDFTWHDAVNIMLEYAEKSQTPIVIAPTGHTPEELTLIKSYSQKIAVFKSANMSIGVNLV